jgi:hypothetical protein
MPRRDSPRRKREKAEDIARHLLSLQRTRGILVADAAGLWLLARPPSSPRDPGLLANSLPGDLPPRMDLANALGCEEVTPIESARLAKWQWALSHLSGRRDVEDLIREGVRPLRNYRGIDFPSRLQTWRTTLESCRTLLERSQAILACQDPLQEDTLSAEMLVAALPARLTVVGAWPIDPAELLQRRDLPADALLLELARSKSGSTESALAAIILGKRLKRAAIHERQKLFGQLPAALAPLFLDAAAFPHSPVLQALAFMEGRWPLPALLGIPENTLDRLLLAGERAALLFGLGVGLRVIENLARPWEAAIEQTGELRQRLERFEQLVGDWQRGRVIRPRSAGEADLVKNLRWLNQVGQGGPRLLARLFIAWVAGSEHGERLIGARPLVRIAQAAWEGGPTAAVRALAQAWQSVVAERIREAEPTSEGARRARLRLTLAHPDVDLSIPAHVTEQSLDVLESWLSGLSAERIAGVWPVLTTLPESIPRGAWEELVRSKLPADVLARIARLGVAWPANTLCGQPGALGRYLDCVEALLALNLPDVAVQEEWLAGLFRGGPACISGVVLTLLRRMRPSENQDRPAALQALSKDLLATGPLAEHARALARALEAWDTPELTAPSEVLPRLAEVLQVEPALLVQYLHHRRLAGHGETVARALLEPLALAERELTEAAFLSQRVASLPADDPKRPHLEERLSRLRDPVQAAARLAESVGRAKHRLERSFELLRQESLEATLDGLYRTYLSRLLGKPIRPGPLPAGTREALALLHAANISTPLLLGFLDDVLEGRPLREREVNAGWLRRAEAASIDTHAWLAGVHASAEVAGETITFATEKDPLHVLRMGSYFETCLTLESGCNAASTLVNALDVNKQVIYGRRGDGAVVARKLIGATATGELAGYRTYGGENEETCKQALTPILADFARRCNLRMSDRATPEVLHPGFWYDDGNEPWLPCQQLIAEEVPAGVPPDQAAVNEWRLVEAMRSGDPARLAALLGADGVTVNPALYRLLSAPAAGEPDWFLGSGHDPEDVIPFLTQCSRFHWLDRPASRFARGTTAERIQVMLYNLPWDRIAVSRAIKQIKQAANRKGVGILGHGTFVPSKPAALASAEELIELYEAVYHLSCPECFRDGVFRDYFRETWADLLQVAWLRDGETRPLVRALEGEIPGLADVVAELACREVVPGLAPQLRSRLEGRNPSERFALALGTQGDPADGPRLFAILRDRPHSLDFALAVVRTGHPEAAAAARALWRPSRAVGDNALLWSRLRELGSPRLGRQLRGEIKDLAREVVTLGRDVPFETLGPLRTLLQKMALLGLPGPDAEPAVLLAPYLAEPAFRAGSWWNCDEERDEQQRIWEDVRRLDEEIARLEAGDSAPLSWWEELRARVARWTQTLRDERFERAIRRIVVTADDPRRNEAIALWLDLAGTPKLDEMGQVLGLLHGELSGLPWSMRDTAAIALWKAPDLAHGTSRLAEALAWLHGRESVKTAPWPTDGLDVFRIALAESPALVLLLKLESPDPDEARTARTILKAYARHPPDLLLLLLDLGFLWVQPDVIEPLAEELMGEIDVAQMGLSWLHERIVERNHSYRWQRLLLQVLRKRYEEPDDSDLERKIRADKDNPRAAWLLGLLAEEAPTDSAPSPAS